MKTKALDRAGRKRTIIFMFAERVRCHNEKFATSNEVAKALGLSPSSKLRNILNEMVAEGLLQSVIVNKQGRWQGRGYMLADGTYQSPQRTIIVKSRKGQLELRME